MFRKLWLFTAIALVAAAARGAGPLPAPSAPAAPAGPSASSAATGASDGSGVSGQPRFFPSPSYYQHIAVLYDGDYKQALDGFQSDYSFGLQAAGTHWVDSICYLTMAGECHYKQGQLADALDDYNAAVKLYLAFPNWMIGIRFPAMIPPQTAPRSTPWGQTARPSRTGRFPVTTTLVTDAVLRDPLPAPSGGSNMISAGAPIQIGVQEIARCTALALKRRHDLLGPLASYDPLTAALAALVARRPASGHPCSQAWIDAELGMAYLGSGKTAEAIEFLKRSASIGGEMDHPLTPLVLLQLGQSALEAGDLKTADKLLAEASYSAFDYGDVGVIEEAFQSRQQVYLALHPIGPIVFPALAAAIPWSTTHGRQLHATLLLLAAENMALLNQTERAAATLAEARAAIGRRDIVARDVGARLNYVAAMVAYHQGRTAAGDQALADALAFERNGSPWLFQIHSSNQYAAALASPLNRKQALPLYAALLRDPTNADWATDPLESLAVLANLDSPAFEHWFDLVPASDVDLSLEVADRLRRRRFFATLPLGGRLMSLRWLLEAPVDSLASAAQLQRQELSTRYPKYGELADRARKLHDELIAAPLAAAGADAERKQADELAELERLSAQQETLLREMAIRRESAEMLFPPLRKAKDVQAALRPREMILAFFALHDGTYAWLLSQHRAAAWKIAASPPLLEQKTAALLRAIGNADANRELSPNQLTDETWRGAAREAFEAITAGSKVNLSARIDELVIVPDGVLWYLPFAALQIPQEKQSQEAISLLAKCRLRYLPTLGLALPDRRESRGLGEVAIVPSRRSSRDDRGADVAAIDRFARLGAHVTPLKRPIPGSPPLYASLFDTLVVQDDLAVGDKTVGSDKLTLGDRSAAYDWSLLPADRLRYPGSLAEWLTLPRKSAAQVLLPGFHTPAESSLRQAATAPRGNDLFLSVCGLMSGGARTVLISRWRTGGASSDELLAQFAQELPYTSAADAWQRSVQMLCETPLDLDREPRVKRSAGGDGLTARHPLFWSGYVLVDTGWTPAKVEPLAATGR